MGVPEVPFICGSFVFVFLPYWLDSNPSVVDVFLVLLWFHFEPYDTLGIPLTYLRSFLGFFLF